jgi:hypothetical protein
MEVSYFMNDDDRTLSSIQSTRMLLKQITSNITKIEGEIDENETFRISFSFNVKDETYIISDLKAYKELFYE